jgi:hypothetical protein
MLKEDYIKKVDESYKKAFNMTDDIERKIKQLSEIESYYYDVLKIKNEYRKIDKTLKYYNANSTINCYKKQTKNNNDVIENCSPILEKIKLLEIEIINANFTDAVDLIEKIEKKLKGKSRRQNYKYIVLYYKNQNFNEKLQRCNKKSKDIESIKKNNDAVIKKCIEILDLIKNVEEGLNA